MTAEAHPLASVVMPTYNDFRDLKGAIAMWRSQTWPNVELIVVDDGSVEPVEPRAREECGDLTGVVFIRHPRNLGINQAIQTGTKRVSGEFVFFSSTNDPVMPDLLVAAISQLQRFPQAGMCFFDPGAIEGWNGPPRSFPLYLARQETYFGPDELAEMMRRSPFHISSNAVVFRTSAFRAIGGFRPDFEIYGDWFGCFLVALRTGAVYVPKTLTFSRTHPGAYSDRRRWPRNYRSNIVLKMLRVLGEEFPGESQRFKRSSVVSAFGPGVMLSVYADPAVRYFFTLPAFVQALGRSAWGLVRGISPTGLRRALRRASSSIAGAGHA